jgi:hypothetical protein
LVIKGHLRSIGKDGVANSHCQAADILTYLY